MFAFPGYVASCRWPETTKEDEQMEMCNYWACVQAEQADDALISAGDVGGLIDGEKLEADRAAARGEMCGTCETCRAYEADRANCPPDPYEYADEQPDPSADVIATDEEVAAWAAVEIADEHCLEGAQADSAILALEDARACLKRGEFMFARRRATDSLAYSVGVFHPAYKAIAGEVRS